MILDDFDWNIIELLQANSRLSYAQLGRSIGLSPSAVAERVQRLEEEDVITKHTSVINVKKVGYTLSAYITMEFNHSRYKSFLSKLSDFPEIVSCSRVTGKSCLIMKVILTNNIHLENLIDRLSEYGNSFTSVILSDVISNGKIFDSRTYDCE